MKHYKILALLLSITTVVTSVCDTNDVLGPTVTGAAIGGLAGGRRGAAIGAGVGLGAGLLSASARRSEERQQNNNNGSNRRRSSRRRKMSTQDYENRIEELEADLDDCDEEVKELKQQMRALKRGKAKTREN